MTAEAKLSSKGQIVIPKQIREKLGLKPGDRVKLETVEGRKAILQPAVKPPKDIFVEAGAELVESALEEATEADKRKIRELLNALGVKD